MIVHAANLQTYLECELQLNNPWAIQQVQDVAFPHHCVGHVVAPQVRLVHDLERMHSACAQSFRKEHC